MSVLFLLLLAETGTIQGVVRYEGAAPPPEPIAVDVDGKTCGRGAPIVREDLVVKSGQLAHVAVVVSMPPDHTAEPSTAHLDQENCNFTPHLQTVTLGSDLIIGNSDPIIHNVHARVAGETVFNLGMPLQGVSAKRKLDRPGLHEMSCDSGHWWMKAYAIVVPHRFHSTTSADGTFAIEGVPAGKRQLWLWHERLGAREVEVEVRPNEVTRLEYIFDDRPAEPAKEPALQLPAEPPAQPVLVDSLELERERVRREGRAVYLAQCATCHGESGDGHGPSARFLTTKPRDFTRGAFKFRTTPSGRAPTIDDVYRTISLGVPGTEMPSFRRRLSKEQRRLLAEYVLTFSNHWKEAHTVDAIAIPEPPPPSPGALDRGRALYQKLKCAQCHGPNGDKRSDADLTKGYYKGGTGIAVIYRALTTGLSGAAMPSFAHVITEAERWDLARYVESLGQRGVGSYLLDPDVGRRTTP